MDRIDLQVEVESVQLGDLMASKQPGESSATIRARVVKARDVQSRRSKGLPGVYCNARMPEQDLDEHCRMDVAAPKFLFRRLEQLLVSARSYTRILKVGRTIADLAGTDRIEMEHVAEAVHFRGLDKPLVVDRKKRRI
jgi:magnesium chelatase family protein